MKGTLAHDEYYTSKKALVSGPTAAMRISIDVI
jgi:hypothetical protein